MAMAAFLVPLHLQDLELAKSDRVFVQHVQPVDTMSVDELTKQLRAVAARVLREKDDGGTLGDSIGDGSDDGQGVDGQQGLLEEDAFDFCYSIVKKVESLPEAIHSRVLLTFSTFVSNATKAIRASAGRSDPEQIEHARNEFKAAVYFLVTVVVSVSRLRAQADKSVVRKSNTASASKTNWSKQFERALHVLGQSICDETFGLWNMNLPEEEFASLYCRAAMQILEFSTLCRAKSIKAEIYQIIGLTMRRVPSVRISTVTSIVDLIFNHEHLTNALAELTEQLPTKYDYAAFPGDLILEIANISSGDPSKDVSGTRNISQFLATLSNRAPSLVISNLTFVLGLLESESYQLRNAGVACVSHILLWSFRQQGDSLDDTDSTHEVKPNQNRPSEKGDESDQEGSTHSDGEGKESGEQNNGQAKAVDGIAEDRTAHQLSRQSRDQLLSILEDRVHDVNSFARSHTLKMWFLLCENRAVPVRALMKLMVRVIGRLQDKAAVVRRQSISLLTLLLVNNPFMGNLSREFHVQKAEGIREMIEERRAKLIEDAQRDMEKGLNDVPDPQESALEREFTTLKRLMEFHNDAIEFIGAFELGALPLMVQLLGSKSTSDTLEAMQFIRQAHALHLSGADAGFKRILSLIWRSDPGIREEVLNVFVSLFLQPTSNDTVHNVAEVSATSLLQLLDECTVAEFTCIEKIIRELHHAHQVPVGVITALWTFIDDSKFPAPVITNAMLLLGMLASADERILLSGERLRQILDHGFGSVACSEDTTFRLLGGACRLIQHLNLDNRKGKRVQRAQLDILERLVGQIQRFLALEFIDTASIDFESLRSTWFDAVQQAIDAVFAVCERPEDVCADVIKCLAVRIFPSAGDSVVDSFSLAHFLFVLGHVAVQGAIRVEQLAASIKRLRANRPRAEQNGEDGEQVGGQNPGDSVDTTAMEDELGVAAEVEAEEDTFVHELVRHDIVCRNLLGMYGPLVVRLLRIGYSDKSYDPVVIESAVVALSKFMAVSDEFCEKNLQLLFTLLQESSMPTVRANIVVALGDLAFRFPNLIEPWTAHLYNRLRDVDVGVRKNTAVVLSHLILNDMVKVKGQISEIAISLVDPSDEIRNLIKLFFHELSRKGNNPIYNIFPDTMNQLSISELVSTEQFHEISKFLLNYLTKDKQIESIVEKLCQRYTAAHPKQRRDFSYCLAHAQHTEKSLRFLHQNQKLFRESLADAPVMDNFKLLITRARRHQSSSVSAEMKEAIDQLEQYIQGDLHPTGEDESDKEPGSINRTRTPSKRRQSRQLQKGAATPRSTPGKRKAKRRVLGEESP